MVVTDVVFLFIRGIVVGTTMMTMNHLRNAIRTAGFHVDIQDDRLVCATRGGKWGLGGNSLWVTKKSDRWYIGTWTPRIYCIPPDCNLEDVIRTVLSTDHAALYKIPQEIVDRYRLVEISFDEFERT